jgi:cytoskeletal protein RodZ
MVHKQTKANGEDAKRLRKLVGEYLRASREVQGLTQRELAEKLNLNYYTFISQLESGSGRVPPHLYIQYAEALHIDTQEFTKVMLRHYDPFTYQALFGRKAENIYGVQESDKKLPRKPSRAGNTRPVKDT